jgi:DNA-binding transcriptional regulator YiaG
MIVPENATQAEAFLVLCRMEAVHSMTHVLTGPTIRALREDLGLTQAQLADLIGYSVRWIRAWESNSQPISDTAADQLLHALRDYQTVLELRRRDFHQRLQALTAC